MDQYDKVLFKGFFTQEAITKYLEPYCAYRRKVILDQLAVCGSEKEMHGLQGQLRELSQLKNFRETLKREG